jgi:hypothetical protein
MSPRQYIQQARGHLDTSYAMWNVMGAYHVIYSAFVIVFTIMYRPYTDPSMVSGPQMVYLSRTYCKRDNSCRSLISCKCYANLMLLRCYWKAHVSFQGHIVVHKVYVEIVECMASHEWLWLLDAGGPIYIVWKVGRSEAFWPRTQYSWVAC